MKIVSVHEGIVPISSSIRNAWIDFSSMDCSIVAVVSDVIVDGKPLVGYGFNSNGRYSAGDILRRRIIPRLLAAPADEILNEDGTNFDPTKAWDFLMRNEKPGGHGERSVAVGVIDMALFDLAAKVAGQPLYRFLSDKYGDGQPDDSVFVYAAGGYYAPDKGLPELQDEMRRFLDLGYRVVKMKIGGAPLGEDLKRIESVLDVVGGDGQRLAVDVNGRFDLSRGPGVREGHRALQPVLVRGDRRPAGLRAERDGVRALQGPDRDRGEPVLPAGRPEPDPLRRDAPRPGHHPGRPRAELRAHRVPADPGHAAPARLVLPPLHPARRAPVLPAHRGRAQARRQRVLPR